MAKTSGTVPSAQRVFLHVGVPHAGTRLLASTLWTHRKELRALGTLFPGGRDRMFRAAVEVVGSHKAHGLRGSEVRGSWDELCRKARAHDGPTVISHELFAAASARQITAALTMLRGLDVHVVLTAQDPARQVVAGWRHDVAHGGRQTFEQLWRAEQTGPELPDLLGRWAASVGSARVHVVTCPPPGPDADHVLWRRFAEAVGVETTLPPDVSSDPLGTDELDLLRRVNVALDGRLGPASYARVVEDGYARQLARTRSSTTPVCPAARYDDLLLVAQRWAKEVDRLGSPVHGDLDDLVPVRTPEGARHPDYASARNQVGTAVSATAELLVQLDRSVTDRDRLTEANLKARAKRKRLERRLSRADQD